MTYLNEFRFTITKVSIEGKERKNIIKLAKNNTKTC